MTPYTIENDVLCVLSSPLAAAGTSLTLSVAAPPMRNPPQPLSGRPGVLTLTDRISNPSAIEVITYTTRTLNGDGTITLGGITRAREGSSAQEWEPGAFAYQAPTRDLLQFSQHLASLDGLAGTAGNVPFFSAAEAMMLAPSSVFGRSLWSVADAAAFRALIGVGALQSVSVTAPLTSTGGATPTIGLPNATTSAAGAMSAADKTKLDGVAAGATNTPLVNVGVAPSALGASSSGSASTAARSDHVHAHGDQAGGSLHAAATTSTAGFMSAADKTKIDGVQAGAQVNVPTNLGIGGTALAPTVTSSTGTAATLPAASGTVAGVVALSAANPQALGSAAPGTAGTAARADHVHPIPSAASIGAIATTHPINPVTALGAVPASVGTSNSAGTSTAVARADHVHAHGDQAGGSLHAVATSGAAGFMSAADKSKLDAVSFAGTAGRLVFLNGAGGLSTAAALSYNTGNDRLDGKGFQTLDLVELGVTSSVPGESAGISQYVQTITGGIASWQWTVRSGDGGGLIRMRLLSGSAGPEISIGSGLFGPLWHHANLDPSSFATLGTAAGAALAASGAAGTATTAARSDHVHPRPTPAEIGAAAATHTHTASQISDSTVAGRALLTAADAAAQRSAMSVESTAQLNSRDTGNRERANHTGNQLANTISDFNAAARAQIESMLVAGTNMSFSYTGLGATRQITLNVTGGSGGSASVGPSGALQSSNGTGGFANSGVLVSGGRLISDAVAFGTADGGAYGSMQLRWDPNADSNPSFGLSRASIALQPSPAETAGQIRMEARNSAGTGFRFFAVEGGQAEPVYFDGASQRNMLHTGNVRTVGGQSLFGTGNIPVGGSPTQTATALTIVAGAVSVDLATSDYFTLLLNSAVTSMTLVNPPAANTVRRIFLRVTRDSNGSRAFTLPAGWTAAPRSAPGLFSDFVAAANQVTDIEAWTLDGTNWQFFIEPLQQGTGTTANGFVPRFRSAADLVNSNIWTNGTNVAIGAGAFSPPESTLFVYGGLSGAHVDVRGEPTANDQAVFDAQSSDFGASFRSIYMRYCGPNAVGTIAGFAAQHFSEIASVGDTFLFRSIPNTPIRFMIDGVEAMQVTKTGIVSTLPITAPNVGGGGGLGGAVTLNVSPGFPAGSFEHVQTFTAAGVTPSSRLDVRLAGTPDTDENDPEMLVVTSMWGVPGAGQITVGVTFSVPTSGPVVVNWSAS